MRITIDRFEGDFAVVLTDDGKRISVLRLLLENGREGDVFDIVRNDSETKTRYKKIKNLIDGAWE